MAGVESGAFVNALLWLSGNALPIAQKAQIGQHAGHEWAHRRGPCPVFSSVMLEKDHDVPDEIPLR